MPKKTFSLQRWIFLIIVPALAITNALLLQQNFSMRSMVFADHSDLDLLKPGDRVRAFQAQLLDGERFEVEFRQGESAWVFLYFSPRCRFSHEQFPYWRPLIEAVSSDFKLVGLVSEHEEPQQVREFLKSMHAEDLPVLRISDGVFRDYKLLITPLTLTVDAQGQVQSNWVGRWGYDTMGEAARLLHLPQP